jgi:hypothetical protein
MAGKFRQVVERARTEGNCDLRIAAPQLPCHVVSFGSSSDNRTVPPWGHNDEASAEGPGELISSETLCRFIGDNRPSAIREFPPQQGGCFRDMVDQVQVQPARGAVLMQHGLQYGHPIIRHGVITYNTLKIEVRRRRSITCH